MMPEVTEPIRWMHFLSTIEEKIVELQQAKQSLADTVTGSADGAILSMKPEELLQLLGEEA